MYIIKIKKDDEKLYSKKTYWEYYNGNGGSSTMTMTEKNISETIQDYTEENEKNKFLANWKEELKDNLWLVKKRQWENDIQKIVYYTYYESDS